MRVVSVVDREASDAPDTSKSIYDSAKSKANTAKACVQMLIGAAAVVLTARDYFVTRPSASHAPHLLISDIAVALAASAVVELAYTLCTKGPDEALDPL